MGAHIRAQDWSRSPFGDPSGWPQSLRSVLSICLNSSIVSAIYWGHDFRLLYNDAYAPALAERHPLALGLPVSEVWAEIWDVLGPQLKAVVETGEGFATDRQRLMMLRQGCLEETFWFYSFAPIRGEGGDVLGVFVNAMDLTSQIASERALRTRDERQRRLLQQMPGFVGVTRGPDHVYEYVNDAFVRIGGPRQYLERGIREVFPELGGQGFYELLDNVYETGEPHVALAMAARLAGEDSERFVDFTYQPIRDDGGTITGVFVGGYEVTELKLAERALREANEILEERVAERTQTLQHSEARARIYFDMAPEYLLLVRVGPDGDVWFEDINPAAETVFGQSREDVIGQRPATVVPPDSAQAIEHYAAACVGTGTVQAYLAERTYQDGRGVLIDAQVIPVERFDDGYGLVLFIGRDVSEQRKVEEQLRQAQKMEAVGQLTGGLAHDFNNLLAGISGALELMQLRIEQGRGKDVDRYLAAAQSAARRAAALTHRLLAFSRRQTLDPRPTEVNRLVLGMEEMIRRTVGPAIAIETVGAPELWAALVDPPQLENALLNLCINARDAMPNGGRITIETANRLFDEHGARTHDIDAGEYLSLGVRDTGNGMSAEVIARVFEPFFTTKPLGEGTGLGLSMIYGFAKQSGGEVRIRSEVGKGTTVTIYLPRHLGDFDRDEARVEHTAPSRAEPGQTVLIVDDEPTVRMLIADVLEDLGYTAIEAADSLAGQKVLQSDVRIDLLVTDVGLPGGLNGRQMADAARETRPFLKVLFITGYAETAVFGNGYLAQGVQVLTKPFVMDALVARIREIIGN